MRGSFVCGGESFRAIGSAGDDLEHEMRQAFGARLNQE